MSSPRVSPGRRRAADAALALWYGRPGEAPGWARLLTPALSLAERAYRAYLATRDASYAAGWLLVRRAGRPVISVGNLTVGGSGKSTCCLLLARMLRERGRRAALVSHAYGGGERTREPVVFRGEEGPPPPWTRAGDEAVMAALADPGLTVVAGADKAVSLERAVGAGADAVILDDAFHRRDLHRDLDLVLFDAQLGLGNGRCLPRGPLREPPQALVRADAFVVSLSRPGPAPEALAGLLRRINPAVPLLTLAKEPSRLETWPAREALEVADLDGRRVLAFCGLGNPGSFASTLGLLGAKVLDTRAYPDHQSYGAAELSALAGLAASLGADCAVTTLKDAVKIDAWPAGKPPLLVLEVAGVLDDPEDWLGRRLQDILA